MDNSAIKRRDWVKNIAIIFLAVMLALTFFSNTIMNFSLPEVAAQYCYGGTVTTRVRGSGNIEANSSYSVNLEETRTIKQVMVKTGQKVTKDEVLFLLEDIESTNLAEATAKLDELRLEYYNKLLTAPSETSETQKSINSKTAELQKLKQKLEGIPALEEAVNVAQAQKDGLDEKIAALNEKITELAGAVSAFDAAGDFVPFEVDISDVDVSSLAEKSAYQSAVDAYMKTLADVEALEKTKEAKSAAKEAADEALKDFEASMGTGTDPDIQKMIDNIQAQERALARAKEDYEVAAAKHSAEVKELYDKYQQANTDIMTAYTEYMAAVGTDEEQAKYTAYLAAVDAAKAAEKAYMDAAQYTPDNLKAQQRDIEDKTIALDKAKAELAEAQAGAAQSEAYKKKLAELKDKAATAKTELTTAEKNLTAANTSLTYAKRDVTNTRKVYVNAVTALYKELLTQAKAQLKTAENSLKEATAARGEDTVASVTKQIETLQDEITKLKEDYAKEKEEGGIKDSIFDLEIEAINKKIEAQEKEIQKLKDTPFAKEIKAPVSGIVTNIAYQAGQKVEANSKVAEIQLVDNGYSLTFTVTAEQSRRFKLGDVANVQYYWGSPITATVAEIKNDPQNPAQSRIVTLNIQGEDVAPGTNISFTLGERSQNYDCVVPNSAIREDNNGKFVLIVDAKSTPLGNRYTARRVDIQVSASDETSSAVTGVSGGDFVITTSTKPITSGMQVRLLQS